jgi:hypothetical protein
MKSRYRRLTFQLVSLFDLLIIIVFAQYFDLQDKTGQKVAQAVEQAEQRSPDAVALQRRLDQQRLEQAAREASAAQKQLELSDDLKRSREDLARLGELVAEVFRLPAADLEAMLRARTPEEANRLRKKLDALADGRSSEAIRHILTLAELEKRCDIWQIHVRDDGSFDFTAGERSARFRAGTGERFAAEVFKQYKNLPQPKSLVVILLSWGDAELKSRTASVEGLELAADRMRADTDRRSRFDP